MEAWFTVELKKNEFRGPMTAESPAFNKCTMSEPRNKLDIEELEVARQVVASVLKDANASLIFGSPVDQSVLPDYSDVIKNPKDLGTILSDLENSINGDGPYQAPEDILIDVELVWQNCLLYNNRPEDKSIVNICKKTSKLFTREWKKAGLSGRTSASAVRQFAETLGSDSNGAPSEPQGKEKGG